MGTPGDRGEEQEGQSGGWHSEWQSGGWQSQWQQPGSGQGWRQEQPPQQQQPTGGWRQNPDGSWAIDAPQASGKATAALILGVLGIVFCPIVFSILALVFGHQGRNEIDGAGGQISGRGLASAGIILGWIGLVIWGLLIALAVIGAIVGDGSTGGGTPTGMPA